MGSLPAAFLHVFDLSWEHRSASSWWEGGVALLVPNTALEGTGRKAAEIPTLGGGQARLVHYNNSWEGGVVHFLLFSSFPFAPRLSSFPLPC